jgi:hypothetical protein
MKPPLVMVITLDPDLEAALNEVAQRQGVAPDVLALNVLRERFLAPALPIQPKDEWEPRYQRLGSARERGRRTPR